METIESRPVLVCSECKSSWDPAEYPFPMYEDGRGGWLCSSCLLAQIDRQRRFWSIVVCLVFAILMLGGLVGIVMSLSA